MEVVKITTDKILKMAAFTDIHWGARANSTQHNQDNLDYIDWFIGCLNGSGVSHIAFLGDWFENRNAINVLTAKYAYDGLSKLNELGLPIFFVTGNHDLYHRTTRAVHSLEAYREFENVYLIDELTSVNDECLFAPYLFEAEYKDAMDIINSHKYAYGHFEFKNFVVTGYSNVMKHGPDHRVFNKPKYIFSGHFHKRQVTDNVIYIGNTFPTNFGDAGDEERGMMTCDHLTGDVQFENWEDCPKYMKVGLSEILAGNWKPKSKTRVKCVVDVNITYSEAQVIRETLIEEHELRELSLEESSDKDEALEGDDEDLIDDGSKSLDELIIESLEGITDATTIDNEILIEQYKAL